MAAPETKACPHCGSEDTKAFPDGSGQCTTCGRAFRGTAPPAAFLAGEETGPRRAVTPREKIRLGLLGIAGGVLGFAAIPAVFLLGASFQAESVSTYVSDVFNRPGGALTCGGVALLVIFAWYALWAGFHVWRGYPERGVHLTVAGLLVVGASGLAGQGLPSVVGIAAGLLALVPGLLVWRSARSKLSDAPPAAPESS